MPDLEPYAWAGTAAQFRACGAAAWRNTVAAHQQARFGVEPHAAQLGAWADSFAVLQTVLAMVVAANPTAASWTLAFEYELAYEGGRRLDLVLLAGERVVVVEFKQDVAPTAAALDQVSAYRRDLELYHAGCRGRRVESWLVPTRRTKPGERVGGVEVLTPAQFADALAAIGPPAGEPIDPAAWLAADYAPLPGVIAAARKIFAEEPLPQIRAAESAGIPEVLKHIDGVIRSARAEGEYHLVLITGVPGSGKTLVGLDLVHRHGAEARTVYLTGNGPLVDVLRYALKAKAFVKPIRNFYLQYALKSKPPRENLFVFDEAQRAWDAGRMEAEYGIPDSAAGAVVSVADRAAGWAVVVALVGEGQEIHLGEESGPGQWGAAVRAATHPWKVSTPPGLAGVFANDPNSRRVKRLDLTTSLRSHRAAGVQAWASRLLAGDLAGARRECRKLGAAGFPVYLTRNLDAAKGYLRERYAAEPEKTFGMVASSRARDLPAFGVPNDYMATKRLHVGAWYVDPPDSGKSCRGLDRAVTEFGCRGWNSTCRWCAGAATWCGEARRGTRLPGRPRPSTRTGCG